MVLPAPAADPGAAQARAWLDKLIQPLELSRGGILLCLRNATPTQLGPVVRALSGAPPWAENGEVLEVCLRATEVLDVPPGSRVLLRVRTEDLDWLNVARPVFAERELRTILWADAAALEGLVRRAVDFFDWVSRVVSVPSKAVPDFAVDGMRAALDVGAEIAWRGDGIIETLAAAGQDRRIELHVEALYLQLVASLRAEGLPIVAGVRGQQDVWRIRMALAEAEREASWVARNPDESVVGMWPLHARQADWEQASARLQAAGWSRPALAAAWFDLEPERIDGALEHVNAPPPDDLDRTAKLRRSWHETDNAARLAAEHTIDDEFALVEGVVESMVADGEIEAARGVVSEWLPRAKTPDSKAAAARWHEALQLRQHPPAPLAPSQAELDRDRVDVDLLHRWITGDRGAGSTLAQRYYSQLRRYLRIAVPEPEIDDVIQDVFHRLTDAAQRPSAVANVHVHLLREAVLAAQRHHDRTTWSTTSPDQGLDPSTLLSCLRKLPTRERSLLALAYWQDLSVPKLAAVFNVLPATIRSWLVQAKLRLRSCMGDVNLDAEFESARALIDQQPPR